MLDALGFALDHERESLPTLIVAGSRDRIPFRPEERGRGECNLKRKLTRPGVDWNVRLQLGLNKTQDD